MGFDVDRLVTRLGEVPALAGVSLDALKSLAAAAVVRNLETGDVCNTGVVVVVSGGLVVNDRDGRHVDLITAGEMWVAGDDGVAVAVVDSDLIELPDEAVDMAWDGPAMSLLVPAGEEESPLAGPATSLMGRVITLGADTPAIEAAGTMGETTAFLVHLDDGGMGIVTDRDLRRRLVAAGLPLDTPVGQIASSPLITVPAHATLDDALTRMIAGGIHHLPLVEGDRVVGLLEGMRMVMAIDRATIRLGKRVALARSLDELASIEQGIPAAVEDLLASGMTAHNVLGIVSAVRDALTTKVIDMVGEPPGPYAWMALGSQGRREQGIFTDQDHALVVGAPEEDDAYSDWATEVVDCLARVGMPRCEGGTMASNPAWRHSVSTWGGWLSERATDANPRDVHEVAMACDARLITGDERLADAVAGIRVEVGHIAPLMARLAAGATHFRVPLGFLGRIRVERGGVNEGTFNVKVEALGPITVIARVFGLAARTNAVETIARLDAAETAALVSPELADLLRHGFELAARLRLERHLECWTNEREPDDRIEPDRMHTWELHMVKEVFRSIRTAQSSLETMFQTRYAR